MVIGHKYIGKRYDGGKSPLAGVDDSVLLAVSPRTDMLDPSESFNISAQGKWSKDVKNVYESILTGKHMAKGDVNKWAVEFLEKQGTTLDEVLRWPERKRQKMCNKIVAAAKEEMGRRSDAIFDKIVAGSQRTKIEVVRGGNEIDSLVDVFENGVESDPVEWKDEDGNVITTTVSTLRRVWKKCSDGITPKQFHDRNVSDNTLIKLCRRVTTGLHEAERYVRARGVLHRKLQQWSKNPLLLERPQGSSLHHFMGYEVVDSKWAYDDCQIVLVENDWGAAVPQIEGEWRVPFELMCWEFRLSGVRVLAMTDVAPAQSGVTHTVQQNRMYLLYGCDNHWVVDGFEYELGCAQLPPGKLYGVPRQDVEFRRVAKFCYDTIRAACIMLDAQVAHQQHVAASPKLKERRARESRSPLRDHYVVRLLHEDRRSFHRARSAGGSTNAARSAQRGHWRKGTWVHYDDPDSGQVQYANDGGFIVSKTWRRWHFAGDPNNIIHKEYRL